MNEVRRRRTLNRYIDSNGAELPLDYHYYIPGAEKQDLCIFCDDYHLSNPVYVWDAVEGKVLRDLNLYMCDQCNTHVESMLHRVYGQEISGKDTIQDDITHESPTLRNSLKISTFVDKLEFDDEIYKYYVHLNPNNDLYVKNNECNKCFICGSDAHGHPIMAYKTWETVIVPVLGEERFFSGGRVFICPDEIAVIQSQFIGVQNIKDLYTHFMLLNKIESATCSNCNRNYYIDTTESVKRQELRGEYICPDCALETIDNLIGKDKRDNWLYPDDCLIRTHPPVRYYQHSCSICRETIFIDRYLNLEYLTEKHLDCKGNIYCEKCLSSGIKKFIDNPLVYKYKSNIYINIKVLGPANLWSYDVVRITKTRELEIVLQAKIELNDITELVSIAFEDTDLLFSGKQLELW